MFCPKCGTENPDSGKFCRSCGTDLGVITKVLSGRSAGVGRFDYALSESEIKENRRKDPDEVFANGIKEFVGGLGFVAVAVILGWTGIIGGKVWWFWLLIPAAAMIGNGVANFWKSKRLEKRLASAADQPNFLNQPTANTALPPSQTNYVAPETRYQTGDLVPPSVTDNTTRHLTMDKEGKTMTLPKK